MKKIASILLNLLICNSLFACSTLASTESSNTAQWDFDHQLQFIKTEVNKNNFQLEVIINHKVKFQQVSAFLLRRSYLICQGYGYKITVINGVESVDYKKASPNLIRSNLVAKLECPD